MAITLDGTTGITTPGLTNTGTETIVNLTTTGNTILGDASTDTLNVGNGGLIKDASGNVGIGTSSPVAKLDVRGIFAISNSAASYWALDRNDSDGSLTFTDTSTERMRIDSSGNLLVGTTSALGAGITVQTGSNTQQLILRYSANAAGKYYYLGSWSNNGSSFVIQSSAGYGVTLGSETATSWSTYSDIRLKTISGRIENALFGVMQLEPIKFSWKRDESNKPQVGISAQSVLPVLPEAVDEAEDFSNPDSTDKYLTVRYTELIPLLTAAIQEQQAMIEELKAKVAALEAA
jgi:hypothetical protein